MSIFRRKEPEPVPEMPIIDEGKARESLKTALERCDVTDDFIAEMRKMRESLQEARKTKIDENGFTVCGRNEHDDD